MYDFPVRSRMYNRTIYSGAPIGLVSLLSARAAGAEPSSSPISSKADWICKEVSPRRPHVLIQTRYVAQGAGGADQSKLLWTPKACLGVHGVENSVHTAVYVSIDRFVFTQTVMTVGAYSRCNSVERFFIIGWEK